MASTIVLVVVFGACALFAVSAFKNGNKLKFFGKKDRKPKSKVSEEEKYKDVVPKEKKEKPKTGVVKDTVKEELKETSEANASKVMKITKEDLKKNDITVPFHMLSDEEKNIIPKTPAKNDMAPKPYDFNFDEMDFNFGSENQKKDLLSDSPGYKDLFAPSSSPEDFLFDKPESNSTLKPVNNFVGDNAQNWDASPLPQPSAKPWTGGGSESFARESVEDRFNKVFGNMSGQSTNARLGKEIILGEVLASPRYRAIKQERERRKKW